MRLGIRLLFAFFLINGIAAFFVLRVFVAEIKPSVREVMETIKNIAISACWISAGGQFFS